MLKSVFLIPVVLLFAACVQLPVNSANKCIPLPDGAVPDEKSSGWAKRADIPSDYLIEVQTKNGENVTIGTRKYYIHYNGMKLGVYSYFGKVGFKAWSCDKDRDPVSGDTPDHMIAVPQPDGSWLIHHAQSPDKVEVTFGADGKPIGAAITLDGIETWFSKWTLFDK
ncbi:MAG: hypothetical protein HYW79_01835 [Parcubacteria group bacterium]|nr:hypothetical protein [Parcubacteria group bacterium]